MGMRKTGLLFRIPVFFAAVATVTLLLMRPAKADAGSPAGGEAGGLPTLRRAAQAADRLDPLPAPLGDSAAKSPPPTGGAGRAYADRLGEEARRLRLSDEPYWHTLLHYKRAFLGLASLVDDPKFFLSPGGKTDPSAELEASIRAFFEPETEGTKHPVCRFIARYAWIKERLNLDPAQLPVKECEPFTRLVREMQPESMTLVFPTAHMNSPASMFGHTLLTYETASKNRLLAFAVNYAAATTETFGPLFAAKGILGFYPGYFSVLPYYAKLQEYADIDRRDMWEYPLTFTPEETIRSLRHVYELEAIYSEYYFFDENCSYVLLFLLEAARPSLRLTERMPPWVIPLDTIRAAEEAGLIAGAVYRPSRTTRIRHLASLVERSSRVLALQAARGRAEPNRILTRGRSREETGRTLDLAVEYLQDLYAGRELGRDAYADRFLQLLVARSSLGPTEGERHEIRPPPRPEEGHRSHRLQLGAGVEKGEAFQEISFRFAYHTLTDDDRGYLEGSHIVFADTALRYAVEEQRLRLERMDLVDIVSLSPWDELFAPISWKIRAGAAQRIMEDGRKHLILRLSPGGGLAYRIPYLGLGYAMLETEANVGEALQEKYALGLGASVGVIRNITDRWKIALSARGMYFGLGDRHSLLDVTLAQNYALTRNLAVSVDVSRQRTREFYRTEAKIALNFFF